MQYIVVILTALFTVGFLLLYKYALNPQTVITPDTSKMATCPDLWNYNATSGMCEPAYKTHCTPFNPKTPTLNTYSSKCNLARSCGTTWSGFCG